MEGSYGTKLSGNYDLSGGLDETLRWLTGMDYGKHYKGWEVNVKMKSHEQLHHQGGQSSGVCFRRDS